MGNRMRNCVTGLWIMISVLSLCAAASASTTSQSLVVQGRALLFNNGSPAYSKILDANEKFKAAAEADSSDQEANLFYAITRLLASALEQGDSAGYETVRDLIEAFGLIRNDADSVDAGAPFNEPPLIYDQYDPPETMPSGEEVRVFLTGPFVLLLDNSIADLDKVQSTFTMVLTADETGDEAVEVDYGDVLILTSALNTLKAAILMATAYDMTGVDIRELIVLNNANVFQIQRDLLNAYANVLKLRTADGAASLINAKTALFAAVDAYRAALTFIDNEPTNSSAGELFYLDSAESRQEAEFILTQLTEIQRSINAGEAAEFTTTDQTWMLTLDGGNSGQIAMDIEFDGNENFVSGDAWSPWDCTVLCGGNIETLTVEGTTVTISISSEGECPVTVTLTGTLNSAGDQIQRGTYTGQNACNGAFSGTFTGQRTGSETETNQIDFNRIFGTSGAAALDIRAVLPQFGVNNEPIAGTFPPVNNSSPVLNGIIPGMTNPQMTDEFELEADIETIYTGSISGTVTCPLESSGNIYILAYDGPIPGQSNLLGSLWLSAPGSYTITALPVGVSVYLFAIRDADDNGVRTFGDYVGRAFNSVTVESGGIGGADFSTDTLIDDSFIMTKPGLYRVFGSNAYTIPAPQYYDGPWNPNEVDWGNSWTLIGESNKTETFNTGQYYRNILIIWDGEREFNFDAFEDLTAETAFATNADGTSCQYQWLSSGLRNSDTDQWTEPSYFKGHPDGSYARTLDCYGFSLFTMPDDSVGNNASRQLKITLISNLKGDMDGDTYVKLADAILALKVVAGLGPDGINPNADVNEDGKIGPAEVIYILRNTAGVR